MSNHPQASTPATLPTSRPAAQALGVPFYRAIKPCSMGHAPTIRKACNGACVQCESDARKARSSTLDPAKEKARRDAWREANRDKHLAGKARYREAHKEGIKASEERRLALRAQGLSMADVCRAWKRRKAREEKAAEKRKASRQTLASHIAELSKTAHALTAAQALLTVRELYQKLKRGRRRARAKGLIHDLTIENLVSIGDWQGWRCAHCGDNRLLEIDHIKAISKGGHHTFTNIQLLCRTHNRDKGNRDERQYRQAKGIPSATPWDVY